MIWLFGLLLLAEGKWCVSNVQISFNGTKKVHITYRIFFSTLSKHFGMFSFLHCSPPPIISTTVTSNVMQSSWDVSLSLCESGVYLTNPCSFAGWPTHPEPESPAAVCGNLITVNFTLQPAPFFTSHKILRLFRKVCFLFRFFFFFIHSTTKFAMQVSTREWLHYSYYTWQFTESKTWKGQF